MKWKPASLDWVVDHLRAELDALPPVHRRRLAPFLVTPRLVPIESRSGETVVVVAELEQGLLYWSDVEEGWELAPRTSAGEIADRGANQFALRHIAEQVFGDPLGG